MNSFSEQFHDWHDRIQSGDIAGAMPAAAAGLHHLALSLDSQLWRRTTGSESSCQLRSLAHQCPYTKRGYDKPRGYPGDAVLLDYIYGSAPMPDGTTPIGRAMLQWMQLESEGFRSVRWRRNFFARRIDEFARAVPRPRVASIACGHFREGQRSMAVREGALDLMVAFDQDPLSLEIVQADQADFGVTPLQGSVRDLLTGKAAAIERMHLIYAAGLYDYLAEPLAKRLTRRLFDRLAPGGTLIIANFMKMWERGWMEAMMDWWLIYRSEIAVGALADEIDRRAMHSKRVFTDPSGNVAYLEVTRGND